MSCSFPERPASVSEWLAALNLSRYEQNFVMHGYYVPDHRRSGPASRSAVAELRAKLQNLTDERLVELGVTLYGHRKRLLIAAANIVLDDHEDTASESIYPQSTIFSGRHPNSETDTIACSALSEESDGHIFVSSRGLARNGTRSWLWLSTAVLRNWRTITLVCVGVSIAWVAVCLVRVVHPFVSLTYQAFQLATFFIAAEIYWLPLLRCVYMAMAASPLTDLRVFAARLAATA